MNCIHFLLRPHSTDLNVEYFPNRRNVSENSLQTDDEHFRKWVSECFIQASDEVEGRHQMRDDEGRKEFFT